MNAWLSCVLTVLCILTIRLEAHITKLAIDWTVAGHVARGLLPIAFLWALGAALLEKKRRPRLIALTGVLVTLLATPLELWYGLMFFPMILFAGR